MNDEALQRPVVKKRAYRKPGLRIYGQVKELTGSGGGTMNGDAGTMMNGSDRRMKRNIVRIGEHPFAAGIGLYLFDYDPERQARCGQGRQFGVMADEVEAVIPAAVTVGADGYKQVDYAMLGISRPSHRAPGCAPD
jgi:hypothetical protein